MPFRFYNYDGDNRWDESKTLLVWVDIDDVVNGDDNSDIILKKATVVTETPNPNEKTPGANIPDPNLRGLTNQKKKSSSTPYFIGGGVLLLSLLGLVLYKRNQKMKAAQMATA